MSWHLLLTIPIALVALPADVVAQRTGGGGSGPALEALQRNPIQVVIDARDELGLTAAQVAQLEPVRTRLREANQENLARIEAIMKANPRAESGNREAMQAMMQRIRPLREAVQQNNRRALQEVRPHFTAEQWERVNDLVTPGRQSGRGGGSEGS